MTKEIQVWAVVNTDESDEIVYLTAREDYAQAE